MLAWASLRDTAVLSLWRVKIFKISLKLHILFKGCTKYINYSVKREKKKWIWQSRWIHLKEWKTSTVWRMLRQNRSRRQLLLNKGRCILQVHGPFHLLWFHRFRSWSFTVWIVQIIGWNCGDRLYPAKGWYASLLGDQKKRLMILSIKEDSSYRLKNWKNIPNMHFTSCP